MATSRFCFVRGVAFGRNFVSAGPMGGTNMKTVAFAAVAALALATTVPAHAQTRGEVSALVGYGGPAFDTRYDNYGFGVGMRAGVTFGHFWLGATATYQFGTTSEATDIDTSGNEVNGQYALSTFSGGGEIGLSLRAFQSKTGWLVIRPFAYVGTNVYVKSPFNTYDSSTDPKDAIVRFVVAPSLHVDYELARSGVFFGADVRVNLLVPGTAPHVYAGGREYAVNSWYDSEHFTGELSAFAVIGKRF